VQSVLLAGAIDYAGLFPPARLDLPEALANYLGYLRSSERWALGRFVIPAARLPVLLDRLHRSPLDDMPFPSRGIPLSVVFGPGTGDGMKAVKTFTEGMTEPRVRVEAVEQKVATAAAVRTELGEIPSTWDRYLEIPAGPEAAAILDAVAERQAFAKLRTGGTTPDAIPAPDEIVTFLERAAERRLPFKATAGLHHPIRGTYPFTYEPTAARAEFYGYLNLLLAAALAWQRAAREQIRAALLEPDPRSIRFNGASLSWRDHRLDVPKLRELRRSFVHSFGSCSFREPLDELAAGPWQ